MKESHPSIVWYLTFDLDDLKFVKAPRSLKHPFHRLILQAEQQSRQLEEERNLP
jgi:hypothetical protein